ncbi:MAG TPA: branched-chain amino acid ABC transporter permease, partial [Spirochaetia bacterium]|nr:branched-chain amino acid ABC transporter permease [Spirochaetia bacterium]
IHALVVSIDIFGMADGISSVPSFPLLPGVAISGDLDARVGNFYIAIVVVVLALVVAVNLIHSRVGRALRAIHGNEQAAGSLGINAARYKLLTFVLSAVFAALGGALLVHYNAAIGPTDINVIKSVRFVAIVAAGGMDSLWGVLSMGFVLNFISLRQLFGSFDDIVFAVILIVIMLFLPNGLVRASYLNPVRDKIKRLLKKGGADRAAGE